MQGNIQSKLPGCTSEGSVLMRTIVGRAGDPGRHRRRSTPRRWVALALSAVLAGGFSALAMGPVPAGAASIVVSEPRARQTLDEAPGWVTLAFSSDIDSSIAKVIVQGPDGDNVTTGSLIVEGTNVTSQLREDLPQGTYTVHYRVNASDGDVQGGAFQFAYVTGDFTKLPDRKWSGSEHEPAILKGTDPNATTEPPPNQPTTTPPDVEVERSDGSTETADPGPTKTTTKTTTKAAGSTDQPTGAATDGATDQQSEAATPTAAPTATAESASRLPLIIGGAVLIIALGAGAVALGLRGRGGGGGGGGGAGDVGPGADAGSSGLTG
jgi:methionine-rich copper-binding protein CopC